MSTTSVIDQNATHQLRGDAEKVSSILQSHVFLINQTQEGLVNQRSGLEGVAWALAAQVTWATRRSSP